MTPKELHDEAQKLAIRLWVREDGKISADPLVEGGGRRLARRW